MSIMLSKIYTAPWMHAFRSRQVRGDDVAPAPRCFRRASVTTIRHAPAHGGHARAPPGHCRSGRGMVAVRPPRYLQNPGLQNLPVPPVHSLDALAADWWRLDAS